MIQEGIFSEQRLIFSFLIVEALRNLRELVKNILILLIQFGFIILQIILLQS